MNGKGFAPVLGISLMFMGALGARPGTAACIPPPDVPGAFQALYCQLQGDLDAFTGTLDAGWNGSPYPGASFSGDLLPAHNGAGAKFLNAGYYAQTITPFLNSLQGLGVKAVKLTISFPILYQPYYASATGANNPALYQQTLNFYKQVAADIRARGLKLIIPSNNCFLGETANLIPYYQSLSFADYRAGRSGTLQTIAQELKPDYLVVQAEPKTEADNVTNTAVSTVINSAAGDTTMVRSFVSDLEAAGIPGLHSSILVGSGMGTWQEPWAAFRDGLTGVAGLDFIDIHVYPINHIGGTDYLARILDLADAARNSGSRVGLSEAWMYKETDAELIGQSLGLAEEQSRELYGFWSPQDVEFLRALWKVVHWKQLDFMNPFANVNFLVALDYAQVQGNHCAPYASCTPAALTALADLAAAADLQQNTITYSATGLAYQAMIAAPTPHPTPAAPRNLRLK